MPRLQVGIETGCVAPLWVERLSMRLAQLSGVDSLLFRRNSVTGALEAVPRSGRGIELNAALHTND